MNLLDTLREQTQALKVQYVEKTIDWANKYFITCVERSSWKEVDWCKYFNIEPRMANERTPRMAFLTFPSGFFNTPDSKRYQRLKTEARNIVNDGIDKFIQKEIKKAEDHYEWSIVKLTDRILKKGLNLDNIKVETSSIGVNINTTITDGNKTVRAFTIIAEGEIQQPHYRYLVK